MQIQCNRKKRRVIVGVIVLFIVAMVPIVINTYVVKSTENHIINLNSIDQDPAKLSQNIAAEAKSKNVQCIMVLGGGLKTDGTPNYMLEDRLDMGIALYKKGVAPKLLLTGDNGQERYDEVNAMKKYAVDRGIPQEDIFMDHAGFSTYESIYRAKAVFDVKNMLIVTQKYHQYRAIYLANKLKVESYGIVSEPNQYSGQSYREFREILARNKDFFKAIIKPVPKYLGEIIPINGSGLVSHD